MSQVVLLKGVIELNYQDVKEFKQNVKTLIKICNDENLRILINKNSHYYQRGFMANQPCQIKIDCLNNDVFITTFSWNVNDDEIHDLVETMDMQQLLKSIVID